jgi:hypothetical protein
VIEIFTNLKKCQLRKQYLAKVSFKNEDKLKIFQTNKLREYVPTGLILNSMVTHVLETERDFYKED